ncbi:hypothetical protein [Lysobacter gummosus]|uniref:hypothetical protein n=1 Tax=Lysobacter gummosus TaxID=262324 RepID=UPI00362B6D59
MVGQPIDRVGDQILKDLVHLASNDLCRQGTALFSQIRRDLMALELLFMCIKKRPNHFADIGILFALTTGRTHRIENAKPLLECLQLLRKRPQTGWQR